MYPSSNQFSSVQFVSAWFSSVLVQLPDPRGISPRAHACDKSSAAPLATVPVHSKTTEILFCGSTCIRYRHRSAHTNSKINPHKHSAEDTEKTLSLSRKQLDTCRLTVSSSLVVQRCLLLPVLPGVNSLGHHLLAVQPGPCGWQW
jgi:hypothetical protein